MPEIDPAWWTTASYRGRPMTEILRERDFGAVFAFLRSRGWSVGAVSVATQLDEYPIREIIKGNRKVARYEVIERIVVGLSIDRHLCGIGFTRPDARAPAASEETLTDWLSRTRAVDPRGLRLLAEGTDHLRRVDRVFGAEVAERQITPHMAMLTSLRDFSLRPGLRAPLSDLICDAAALAGWVALDMGDVDRAWRYHEAAKVAGWESGSTATLAHALAQQAYVLVDIGNREDARALAEYAVTVAGHDVPPVLRSWLAAVAGEIAAIDGDTVVAHRQFDLASRLLPPDSADPEVPYIVLDEYHLARWRGAAAARLGDATAIAALEFALSGMDATFFRARAQSHVELGYSLIAAGRRDEAARHVADARTLAGQVGSLRQCRRAAQLESALANAA